MCPVKKIFFVLLLILFSAPFPAYAAQGGGGLGISAQSFIRDFYKASAHVTKGLSPTQSENGKTITPEGNIIIAHDTSVILMLKRLRHTGLIENISVSYFYDPESYSSGTKDSPDAVHIFTNVCLQVIFALNEGISDHDARTALRDLGVHGPILDGIQRRKIIGKFIYLMKFQPNGVTIMAVSHI